MNRICRLILFRGGQSTLIAGLTVAVIIAGGCGPRGEDALNQGVDKLRSGDFNEAARLLERAGNDLREASMRAAALNYLGMAYAQQGQTGQARIAFTNSAELDLDYDSPHYNLGVLFFQQGDYIRAAQQLNIYTAKNKDDYMAFCYLASCYLRSGSRDVAAKLYQRLNDITESTDNKTLQQARALAANGLGVLSAQRGQTAEAVRWFEQSLQRDPTLVEARLNLAELLAANKPREALEHYRAFLEARPKAPRAARVKQVADVLEQRVARMTPVANTASATPAVPTDPFQKSVMELQAQIKASAEARRNEDASTSAFRLSELYRERNDTAKMVDTLQSALSYDARNVAARLRLAQHFEALNDSRALGHFKQIVELDPSQTPAWRSLLTLSRKAGDYETAVTACKHLLAKQENDEEVLFALATIYDQNLKRPTDAVNAYDDFVARFPKDNRASYAQSRMAALQPPPPPPPPKTTVKRRVKPTPFVLKKGDTNKAIGFYNEGVRMQQQQRLDEATGLYQKAIATDPTLAQAYYNLGQIFQSRGDLEKAINHYETATRAQSNYVAAHLNMALALKAANYPLDAVDAFKKVLDFRPDEPAAHLELGNLYARDPESLATARQHYEKFVQLAPDSSAAREVRRWLASQKTR